MKNIFFLILTTLFSINVIGQTTEFSLHFTSGLFSFRGSESGNSTFYTLNDPSSTSGRTNTPWGNSSGASYGFALNAQRVTKFNLIFGLQTGYESLSSRIKIRSIWVDNSSVAVTPGSKTDLNHQFINLHPFIGKRFNLLKNFQSDLILGLDLGIFLKVKEEPNIKSSLGTFDSSRERNKPEDNDFRLRIDLINYYKNYGLTIGYSYGLTNYMKGYVGGSPEVYSRMLRLGLVYKICI